MFVARSFPKMKFFCRYVFGDIERTNDLLPVRKNVSETTFALQRKVADGRRFKDSSPRYVDFHFTVVVVDEVLN